MSASSSPPRPTNNASARGPLSLWWAVPCGVVLGILTLIVKPGTSTDPIDPTTLVPHSRLAEMWQSYPRVSFSLLSGFAYGRLPGSPGIDLMGGGRDPIPPDIRALNRQRVSIDGFMLPIDFDGAGVTTFLLNASYDMCYFGAPTQPNEFIVVKMRNGRRTRFVHTPVAVFGTLIVEEERRDGRVVSLYRMDAEAIGLGAGRRE
jgi:hypothetical protein